MSRPPTSTRAAAYPSSRRLPAGIRLFFRGPAGPLVAIILCALAGLLLVAAVLTVLERQANARVDALTAAHSHQFLQSSRLDPIELRALSLPPGEIFRPTAEELSEVAGSLKASLEGLRNRRAESGDPREQELLDAAIDSGSKASATFLAPAAAGSPNAAQPLDGGRSTDAAIKLRDWLAYSSEVLATERASLSRHRQRLAFVVGMALLVSILAGVLMWVMLRSVTRRSMAELETAAATDSLTGLENQGAFHERLAQEVARSERSGTPLSLVVLDIDHFKTINDTHGHQVGDTVLAAIGRALRQGSRRGELIARIGGEEFAWLTPDADSWGALAVAERARGVIGSIRVEGVEAITASAGVAEHEPGGDADTLMRHADQALYLAKANGRNASFRFGPGAAEVFAGALSPEDFVSPA